MYHKNLTSLLPDTNFAYIFVPRWTDECRHSVSAYVGTLKSLGPLAPMAQRRYYDVYVFQSSLQQEVCLRYGSSACAYISPGTVLDLLRIGLEHGDKVYLAAAKLICDRMTCQWTKDPQKGA